MESVGNQRATEGSHNTSAMREMCCDGARVTSVRYVSWTGMRTFLIILLAGSLTLPSGMSSQEKVRRRVDILTLRFLLANRLYDELERRMQQYQRAAELDVTREVDVERALNAFAVYDRRMADQVDKWLMRYPGSAMASAALSRVYLTAAWEVRGTATARETSTDRMNAMASGLELARINCERAIKLNPRLTICYEHLLTIYGMIGDQQSVRRVVELGLRVQPAGYLVRSRYMWNLLPQWGGSHEAMDAFAEQSQAYVQQNPILRTLKGNVGVDQARRLSWSGQIQPAIDLLRQVEAAYGGRRTIYLDRASLYFQRGDLRNALADCERGLAAEWQDVELLELKARILTAQGNRTQAARIEALVQQLRGIVTAIRPSLAQVRPSLPSNAETPGQTESTSPEVHTAMPVDSSSVGVDSTQSEGLTIDELSSLIGDDPQDVRLYFRRGTAYIGARDYSHAMADFDKVLEMDSSNVNALYNLGWLHLRNGMYDRGIELNAEVIRRNDRFGEAFMNRSFGYRMLGRFEEAERDLLRACELGVEKACTLARHTGWIK